MPLTDELGEHAMDLLGARGVPPGARPYSGSGFESWLSRLAEPQPDLTAAENLENRAMFLRASAAVRDAIIERSLKVLAAPQPKWWLQRMIGALHFGKATVASFNYDLMVELTLHAANLFDENDHHVSVEDIVRYGPSLVSLAPAGIVFGHERARSFRYLRLHGSIDAFWVPGDEQGTSIGRWKSAMGWGRPVNSSEDERLELLPDRVPFIVPPAAAKSSFYNNPLTRQMWRLAAQAVKEADEVALVGYSLPMTDLVTSGMLGERLRGEPSSVVVVNRSPEPVVRALGHMGIESTRIRTLAGDTAVESYVDDLEASFSPAWGWERPATPETPLAVGKASSVAAFVVAIRSVVDQTVHLDVSHKIHEEGLPRVTLGQLLNAAGGPPTRVYVHWPDGRRAAVAWTRVLFAPSGVEPDVVLMMPTAVPTDLVL
ncbi:hypothetical protein [Pimelobacter simplex]|uniref:hypothetical protein n=1 Tax=Nocardioides simplex TaxID=2045 RepID=UPI003AB04BD9